MKKADWLSRKVQKPWGNPRKLRCPYCRSVRLRKNGIVAGKQRYFCKNCATNTIKLDGG